jgi:hypothetical protein
MTRFDRWFTPPPKGVFLSGYTPLPVALRQNPGQSDSRINAIYFPIFFLQKDIYIPKAQFTLKRASSLLYASSYQKI